MYVLISAVNEACNRGIVEGEIVYSSAAALEFVNRVGGAASVASTEHSFSEFLATSGFVSYAIGRVVAAERFEQGGQVWVLSPHGWLNHWSKQRYAKVEPTAWYWRKHPDHHVVKWTDVRKEHCGPRPRLMDEARDFGLHEGLAVALKLPAGDFATAVVGTEASEISSLDAAAVSFASIVCVSRIAQLMDAKRRRTAELTARQRECLTWAACGKTDWEISQILALSQRTVQEHLGRCVTKLGASNRAHAVAIAVLESRISP